MTPKTALFSMLGTSVIGGTITGGYFFMQPTTIKESLILGGSKLLDIDGDKNDKEWKKLIEKHTGSEVTIANNNKISTIKDLTIEGSNDKEKIKKLKDKCKELFNKPISQKSEFEDSAKNWCTEESPILKENQTTSSIQSPVSQGVSQNSDSGRG